MCRVCTALIDAVCLLLRPDVIDGDMEASSQKCACVGLCFLQQLWVQRGVSVDPVLWTFSCRF